MKGKFRMLKNIQIKIVLIFLLLGIIIIGIAGYINYEGAQKITEFSQSNLGEFSQILKVYQSRTIIVTIIEVCLFTLLCILARYIYKRKNDFTDSKTH